MKRQIPNALTLTNLFCGCMAIVCAIHFKFIPVIWLIVIAFVADALDGQVARWLNVSAPIGKQLDSLADMVSFGVLPGMILYSLLIKSFGIPKPDALIVEAAPAFILSVFAGYRLAKFNVDTRQSDVFLGLATPACTVLVAGIMLVFEMGNAEIREMIANKTFLYSLIIVLSFFMVSDIPLLNFRFPHYKWKGNKARWIFIAGLPILGIISGYAFFALAVLWYILVSFGEIANQKLFS
ncbi:MAG: CDP-diacylglycerol--serine O-phosphatidyltransferase [Saprospiraceae bacterium]|nr:CDP-diacylglycerol--serine O-phosphatidyltransferase [Saprospiraceae bacterium]